MTESSSLPDFGCPECGVAGGHYPLCAQAAENSPRWVYVQPPTPGCLCEATDYERVGPCCVPGHDSRVTPSAMTEETA